MAFLFEGFLHSEHITYLLESVIADISSYNQEGLSQLTRLLHPVVLHHTGFSPLFSMLPQELYIPFSNCLVSTIDLVRTTLPPAFTSPLPENLALYPDLSLLVTEITSVLTNLLGTVLTTVKLFIPSQDISTLVSKLLTAINTGLYGNPTIGLPDLLNSLYNSLDNVHTNSLAAQPYSALTNFPYELFAMLNSAQTSVLHPLPIEFDNHLSYLLTTMVSELNIRIMIMDITIIHDDRYINVELNEEQWQNLIDSPVAPDYHLEGSTVQHVYQARGDSETDPVKCSICLEEMKDGDNARRLGCLHLFHVQCIDGWLETKRNCPLCRTPIDATHD